MLVSPQLDVLKEWNTAIDFQSIELEHVAPNTTWIEPALDDDNFLNMFLDSILAMNERCQCQSSNTLLD